MLVYLSSFAAFCISAYSDRLMNGRPLKMPLDLVEGWRHQFRTVAEFERRARAEAKRLHR
jgi:hypothetical protein